MRLVYKETQDEVQLGDMVTLSDGQEVEVTYFRKPHKPGSSGKVSVNSKFDRIGCEFFVGVIGAEWIDREDLPKETL
jgi:putative transposon-encoded protein